MNDDILLDTLARLKEYRSEVDPSAVRESVLKRLKMKRALGSNDYDRLITSLAELALIDLGVE